MIELFEESFNRYYGIDWVAMVLTFYSINSFSTKSNKGFVFGGLASLAWLFFNVLAASIAGVLANIFFIYMHVSGYMKWKKEDNIT